MAPHPRRRAGQRAARHLVTAGVGLLLTLTLTASGGMAPASAESGQRWRPPLTVGQWPGAVTGLGDSVPAGSECRCTSYVRLVAQALAGGNLDATHVANLAQAGATSTTLRAELRRPRVRAAVSSAALTVVTVGANDLSAGPLGDPRCRPVTQLRCYRPAIAALTDRLAAQLDDLQTLAAPGHGVVAVTGYWNVFLDGAVGRRRGADYVTGSDALTRAVNAGIMAAAGRAHVLYVDIYQPFKGNGSLDCTRLLAPDGDHPNAQGHRVIADAVLAALTRTAPLAVALPRPGDGDLARGSGPGSAATPA